MFEDSTFESNGRIRTRSRAWMMAAFAFNGSILLALILIPLVYPEALPSQATIFVMTTPPPPPPTPPLVEHVADSRPRPVSEMFHDQLIAPRRIPTNILIATAPEPAPLRGMPGDDLGPNPSNGPGNDIFRKPGTTVVHPDVNRPVRVSTMVEAGLLIQKTVPRYPDLAKAMHIEGTVVLAATISKTGTIENLRVVSGPPVLQQAALDAVKTWQYRPYLLNGEPVEVETGVNVIFTMQH